MTAREAVEKFQTQNPEHIQWLKNLFATTKTLTQQKKNDDSLYALMDNNPFGIKFKKTDYLSIPEIHFGMAMKYAESVLDGTAYTPPTTAVGGRRGGPFGPII